MRKTLLQCERCHEYSETTRWIDNKVVCSDCHTSVEVVQLKGGLESLKQLKKEFKLWIEGESK